MSIRIKAFTEDDLNRLYNLPVVHQSEIVDAPEAKLGDLYKIPKAEAHVRRYINLAYPCINTVTCGSGFTAGTLVYDKASDLKDLANFEACLNLDNGEIERYDNQENCLFNGEALLYSLDRLDVVQRIEGNLRDVMSKHCHTKFSCSINKEKRGFTLLADWCMETDNLKVTQESINNYLSKNMLQLKTATRLINLLHEYKTAQGVIDYLKAMLVLKNLTLVPMTLRMGIDGRNSPLTTAYLRLFTVNMEAEIYAQGSLEDRKEHYRSVYNLVLSITNKNVLTRDKDFKRLVPVMDKLKGKTGGIRLGLLAKRQDYSGRSAVIINPFLPLNTIRVPRSMLHKLFRRYSFAECGLSPEKFLEHAHSPAFIDALIEDLIKNGVIENIPIVLGRNPSLHRNSVQGFNIEIGDGRAIEVPPLVCPAFNMDFDGDTGHDSVPITPQGAYEIKRLIMTDLNPLLAKTGECTIMPRMDIIYGLYMCTRSTYKLGPVVATFPTVAAFKYALYNQDIMVWDTVTVTDRGTDIAGYLAFATCFKADFICDSLPVVEITSKTIKRYINQLVSAPVAAFDAAINSLVELGFKMANIYSMSVSMLQPDNDPTVLNKAIDDFHESMEEIMEKNDLGYYDSDMYSLEYSNKLRATEKTVTDNIMDYLNDENMFKHLALSGARGNTSNLNQIYRYKGQIQKSDTESFNVAILKGLRDGFTPIEMQLAANGARKGQMAKSIKTADVGYMRRKMEHATSPLIIMCEDCGTADGITIRRADIAKYIRKPGMTASGIEEMENTVDSIMQSMITGRYGADNSIMIAPREARKLVVEQRTAEVRIRSPLTCKDPCCQKCYGTDPSTNRPAAIGLPIGFLSAQSLAEPLTQMSMNDFKAGGVVRADVSSSPFSRFDALIGAGQISKKAAAGEFYTYDPIAWAPGVLVGVEHMGNRIKLTIKPPKDMTKEKQSRYNYKDSRIVPDNTSYRIGQKVELGETLREVAGDCDPTEVAQYVGIDEAQLLMFYNIYFLFRATCELVSKHIEVLVTSLVGYMPLRTDIKELKLGKYYSRRQLVDLKTNFLRTTFIPAVRGVSAVTTGSVNFLEALVMENQGMVLCEAVLNAETEPCTAPLVQIALGQVPKVGTGYNTNFLEER